MMKTVAGMGSIDDYTEFVKAGADELFIGYVPEKWQVAYGLQTPLNRREVCYYNVQIGSQSELEILAGRIRKYRVPVTIALNGLHYTPEQFPLLAGIIRECSKMGFSSFIIADYALLIYLYQQKMTEDLDIHVSGEFGEINHYMWKELEMLGVKRLIFHRKADPADMAAIIAHGAPGTAYEAFFLNEKCHFHGGFCNSVHCDEMEPICRLPYRLTGPLAGQQETGCEDDGEAAYDGPGVSGCAFCELWKFREMGITHLKVVGRGACSEDMIRDIRAAKQAEKLLEQCRSEEEFISRIRAKGCSGNCYYRA